MIAALKFFHIAALSIWCAGLVGLPLLLARHHPADDQAEFARTRLVTNHAYVRVVTPAAVIAIALGTALVFMRGVFVPWMFAKLVLVGLLVLIHAWIGHITLKFGEEQGHYRPPPAGLLVGMSLLAMLAILILVLGKPFLAEGILPDWLLGTQGQPLPLREVPIW
ncbi:CopD family protein [Roseococcus pinisoli]|uniref:Protoporphyrinogen IX oxidase n=1 Tax=Roseococcus pinisoli TaxID=2835040 RepID=A0ABS5QJD5_9PROT|nr:CopD family protein [Roseococcus pinisoli]MBS7813790.1 CopD family protein [Roseococcus pinisoli]